MLVFEESVVELRVLEDFYRAVLQHFLERREVPRPEHVHDEGLFRGGELQQARPAVTRAEARSFEVHPDLRGASQGFRDAWKLVRVADEPVVYGAFLHASILAG